MQVDVDNGFNSTEDCVQYALGSMDAYSVNMRYESDSCSNSCVTGIVALNHTEALIKYLLWWSKLKIGPQEDYLLQVILCE